MVAANIIPFELPLPLNLPTIEGNVDYRDFRAQLLRIDGLLVQSGLETQMIEADIQRWQARQKRVRAKARQNHQVHARRARRCNIARLLIHENYRGFGARLADSPLLPRSVARMQKVYAPGPQAVAGDRGFGSQLNRFGLKAEGIFNAVCPRAPRQFRHRNRSWKFKRLQRRRAQTEGRIGIFKNVFLGGRMRCKGFATFCGQSSPSLSKFRAIFKKTAISRFSVTGNSKMRVRFPRFSRLANPGQPLANTALSAQSAVANPSRETFSSKNTIFRYSVTGGFSKRR